MTRLRVLIARLLGLSAGAPHVTASCARKSTRTSTKPPRNSSVRAFRPTRRDAWPSRNSEA